MHEGESWIRRDPEDTKRACMRGKEGKKKGRNYVREVRLFEEGGEEGEKAVPSALQAARGQRSAVRRGRRSGIVKHEARQRPCRACAGELKPAFTCLADRP